MIIIMIFPPNFLNYIAIAIAIASPKLRTSEDQGREVWISDPDVPKKCFNHSNLYGVIGTQ